MTLGISVEHFDFRVDLYGLIAALSSRVDVVIFTDRPFNQPIKGLKSLRLYRPRRSIVAAVAARVFLVCRRLPRSQNNFFITELFGLAALPAAAQRRGLLYLRLRRLLPWGLPVDWILPAVGGADQTSIEDVDVFLHITRIGSLPFLRRTIQSGRPNLAYVYSWDHPCKHTSIPRTGISTFLTWNRKLSTDMVNLQGIEPTRLREVGATQLSPLFSYQQNEDARRRLIPHDYVYFGCGVGQKDLVVQEVEVIRRVAAALAVVAPALVLLVRPYPNFSDWTHYEALRPLPNVQFDWFRQAGQGRSLTPAQVEEKYNKIEHARAFVHIGTTMGWEACYFETPVLFLSLDDIPAPQGSDTLLDLRRFVHQYHNDRYMILDEFPNVVRRTADLVDALRQAVYEPRSLLGYNRVVAADTPLRTVGEIADDILKVAEERL